MNVLFGILIVLAAAAVGVAAILLVRRRAPDGSYFNDGDRAAGVFGVLATGFSVLLGFLIFQHDPTDGFFQPAGIIGSVIGAVIVLFLYTRFAGRGARR